MVSSDLPGQTPAYLHYDVSNGLPGNIIYCAAQDERGFMWFGTDKGLACFDGTRFRTFGVKDGLPDPEVLNLKMDSQGRLWIFSFKQKPCFRYRGELHTEKNDSFLSAIELSAGVGNIIEDSDKSIWFYGQAKVLYRLKQNSSSVENLEIAGSIAFLIDKGSYFISCNKNFFSKITKNGLHDTFLPIDKELKQYNYLGAGEIYNEKILISFTTATFILSVQGNGIKTGAKILDTGGRVYTDSQHNTWVCTTSSGAIRFMAADTAFHSPDVFLSNKKVTTVLEDSEKGVWFCTAGEGVYYLPENHASIYSQNDGLINNNITTLTQSAVYGLLGGDDQGNVYAFNNRVLKLAGIGAGGGLNRCRQIVTADDGKIYVVSDYGLSVIDHQTVTTHLTNNAGKYLIKKAGGWLMGTSSNLYYLPEDSLKSSQILVRRRTTAIARDSQGYFWVGGINGLYSSRDNYIKNWGDLFPPLKSRVIAIKSDQNDKLWVATPNFGLLHITVKEGEITGVEEMNDRLNVAIDNIQSLFLEKEGRIWLATNKGVFGIDQHLGVVHFDRNNGLAEDDVNDVFVLNDTLWAGTVAGLSKVVMSGKNMADFPTFITQLRYRLGDKNFNNYLIDTFSSRHIVRLSPEASLIEFDLGGLDFSSRGNMNYNCIIKKHLPAFHLWTLENITNWIKNGFDVGRDSNLIQGSTLNFGVYLLPGRYEIEARAINPNGVVSPLPAVWVIDKLPEWYQTIWFYLAIWALVGYILWRMIKAALAYRKLQTAVSELRLQAIQSQINPHFIGNSINAIQQFFFPPDPVRASDYIAIFTRLLRTTMDFSERPFVTLEEEMTYNEDYLRMIQLRFGGRFQYSVYVADDVTPETKYPTMILQPILENATIHGLSPDEQSVLEISITREKNGELKTCVTDNGLGYNKSKLNNLHRDKSHKSKGLILLQRKVKTLNELYHTGCSLEIVDISEEDPSKHGTRATLVFYPDKILHPEI